ncbi:hypothetical protein C8R44DRAFT_728286 [Mycena epipterygia]|nr:hypothetical protein C8R44DRAFT_728286 [Mycena epipterygia]
MVKARPSRIQAPARVTVKCPPGTKSASKREIKGQRARRSRAKDQGVSNLNQSARSRPRCIETKPNPRPKHEPGGPLAARNTKRSCAQTGRNSAWGNGGTFWNDRMEGRKEHLTQAKFITKNLALAGFAPVRFAGELQAHLCSIRSCGRFDICDAFDEVDLRTSDIHLAAEHIMIVQAEHTYHVTAGLISPPHKFIQFDSITGELLRIKKRENGASTHKQIVKSKRGRGEYEWKKREGRRREYGSRDSREEEVGRRAKSNYGHGEGRRRWVGGNGIASKKEVRGNTSMLKEKWVEGDRAQVSYEHIATVQKTGEKVESGWKEENLCTGNCRRASAKEGGRRRRGDKAARSSAKETGTWKEGKHSFEEGEEITHEESFRRRRRKQGMGDVTSQPDSESGKKRGSPAREGKQWSEGNKERGHGQCTDSQFSKKRKMGKKEE